jgi:uncharacterized protein (DUF849 family)
MAMKQSKVVINCAVTGSIHIPTMSDYLPVTPQQIADEGVRAADAGAGTVHLHVRNPETGLRGDPKTIGCGPVHYDGRWAGDDT